MRIVPHDNPVSLGRPNTKARAGHIAAFSPLNRLHRHPWVLFVAYAQAEMSFMIAVKRCYVSAQRCGCRGACLTLETRSQGISR